MSVEKLAEGDRLLLQSAAQASQQAAATHDFISRHIAQLYGLGDGCQVDITTGVITRTTAKASPAEEKPTGHA